MQKVELVSVISARTGIPQSKSAEIIDTLTDVIMEVIADGGTVNLAGFGIFKPKLRKAHKGWNLNVTPAQRVMIPERIDPVFEPGLAFKELMNERSAEN